MMAKKEKEMPKENTINIFGKEYTQKDLDALSPEQKAFLQHRQDLMNKVERASFNLTQLRIGLKGCEDALIETGMEVVEKKTA
jgi:hypothetical protein